jgi:hypothetical protein
MVEIRLAAAEPTGEKFSAWLSRHPPPWPGAKCFYLDLPLLKTPEGTILASQPPGTRGMSANAIYREEMMPFLAKFSDFAWALERATAGSVMVPLGPPRRGAPSGTRDIDRVEGPRDVDRVERGRPPVPNRERHIPNNL